jgi:hypothetical protein
MMGGRRKRTMKGGMGYGFGGAMGTNGPVWDSSWGGEVTKAGEPIYDTASRPPVTGGRRKSKKSKRITKKKTRKSRRSTRRRPMRGGAQWQSAGAVGYGYTGAGARGLADPTAYASKVPPSGAPSQNPDGAYRA